MFKRLLTSAIVITLSISVLQGCRKGDVHIQKGVEKAPVKQGFASQLYTMHCASCHGMSGLGDGPVVSNENRLGSFKTYAAKTKLIDVATAIKEGRKGTMMAAWGQVLSEPEIEGLALHIIALSKT